MKIFALSLVSASLLALSGCEDASSPEAVAAKAERIETKTMTDLSKMEFSEIIDFVDDEASQMTGILKTVTDGPSAEAAVKDIRDVVPRLNAAIKSLENANLEEVKMNLGNMRRMFEVAQSQKGLVSEVTRISQIPEARAVLQKEFEKIELPNN